jgi:hypothetical protein
VTGAHAASVVVHKEARMVTRHCRPPTRIVTRHCRPPRSKGMGAYSIVVTAPVHSVTCPEASIPAMVIGMLDRNDSVH